MSFSCRIFPAQATCYHSTYPLWDLVIRSRSRYTASPTSICVHVMITLVVDYHIWFRETGNKTGIGCWPDPPPQPMMSKYKMEGRSGLATQDYIEHTVQCTVIQSFCKNGTEKEQKRNGTERNAILSYTVHSHYMQAVYTCMYVHM